MDKFIRNIQSLTPKEEDNLFTSILQQKFDQELKEEWSIKLSKDFDISKTKKDPGVKKWNFRHLILIGSSIAASILFLLIWQTNFSNQTMNAQEFALIELDEKLIHPGNTKGDISSELSKQEAIQSFNNKDYNAAISHFEELKTLVADDQFYLGMSYLYNKQYDQSISIFEEIPAGSNVDQEVKWFLSIAYVLHGDDELAKDKLNNFGESEWKATKAKKLLQTIKHQK